MPKQLRLILEIVGAVAGLAVAYVAWQEHTTNQTRELSNAEHGAIVQAIKAETDARKDGDKRLAEAVDVIAKSSTEQTKAVTTLVAEMKIILHKLNLDGTE